MKLRPTLACVATLFALARPAAQAQTGYALLLSMDTPTFRLATLDLNSGGTLTQLPGLITGLGATQVVAGIEVRPSTGQLYLLASNGSSSNPQQQLFVLNPSTRVAAPVGSALALALGSNHMQLGLTFDPGTDVLRVTSSVSNYRLDPTTGAVLGTDAIPAYDPSDVNAGQPATLTRVSALNGQLYGFDYAHNRLVTLSAPPSGLLRTVGPLAVSYQAQYVCLGAAAASATAPGLLYLVRAEAIGPLLAQHSFYTLDPVTGAATPAGARSTYVYSEFIADIAMNQRTVAATRAGAAAVEAQLFPNPAAGPAALNFTLAAPGLVSLETVDVLGRRLGSTPAEWRAVGRQQLAWPPQDLPSGSYFLRLRIDGQVAATRLAQLSR